MERSMVEQGVYETTVKQSGSSPELVQIKILRPYGELEHV